MANRKTLPTQSNPVTHPDQELFTEEGLHYPDASGIDALLKAIKRPCSYRVKQLLTQSGSRLLERLTVRQLPGVTTFRYWQEGPGYDRNFTNPAATLTAIDYLHHNPVRRSLVNTAIQWKWSSARYYFAQSPQQYPDLPTIYPLLAHWLLEDK